MRRLRHEEAEPWAMDQETERLSMRMVESKKVK